MWNILSTAHEALLTTVKGVPADGWHRPTPCAEWNVTQVLQHAVGDQLAYASAITGEGGPDFNPFAPSGHVDGDPLTLAENATSATSAAWATIAPDAENVPVPIPPNSVPAWMGAGAAAMDAAVHAWDIAVATGQASPLTPELAAELMPVAQALVEPLRPYGAFAAALDLEDGDDPAAALLRYLGRDPHWTAA
ncbi:TIGR03086 family protein [Streptosporangiaceae bacterium NEAU-GS5]|nr:TIGR03086 family protein [Streptosporangiaceae bacterium NEAU-GS5]